MTPEEQQAREDGMMLGEIKGQLKSIDSGIKELKADVKDYLIKTDNHEVEIEGLKKDRKWLLWLGGAVGGSLGLVATLAVEYFKK